ncbi:helix-hairpin-helix domain-containing protein [Streptomyces canus]|uniref:ComEA family DNA-binding protein n=1 Tax=Streptomyces canus TaxID=58343 RepID=UPI0033B2D731
MAARVDINRAGSRDLQLLPGIGKRLAARIVEYRQRHGDFATFEDLSAVPGVTEKVVGALRDHATVDQPAHQEANGLVLRVRLIPEGEREADLTGYGVRASFERREPGLDGEHLLVPTIEFTIASQGNIATFRLPPKDQIGAFLTLQATAPDGRVLASRKDQVSNLDDETSLSVDPVSYDGPVATTDPAFGRPRRLRGRVIDSKGAVEIGRRQVVLWGVRKGDANQESYFPLVAVETDLSGYFSGQYPVGDFSKARGTVALGAGEVATVPITLDKGALPEVVLLVVDLPEQKSEEGNCSCDGGETVRRDPDARDLTNPDGIFSADLGGGRCVDFTKPDRTLEEYSYSYAVRTTEPQIRGLTLDDEPTVPVAAILERLRPFGGGVSLGDMSIETAGGAANSGLMPVAKLGTLGRQTVNAKLARALLADPNSVSLVKLGDAVHLSAHRNILDLLERLAPREPGRNALDGRNPVDWDDDPTIYQAVTIAHGHLLRFKQEWVADGYSLGDLLYSLPLAPAQRKMIAIVDWERREEAARTEFSTAAEQLAASLNRERDITDIVTGTVTQSASGGSSASSSAFGGGLGVGAVLGPVGALIGVGGGTSSANSSSWERASRSSSAYALNQLRDRTLQSAAAVRSQRSSVVQSVTQGERVSAQTELVANYNHCHAITIQYFQVLRHLLVRQRLTEVQECLFIPLLMTSFTPHKVLRWADTLRPALPPSLRIGLDALSRIESDYVDSDLPTGAYADEQLDEVDGELFLRFQLVRPKDVNDTYHEPNWGWLSTLLGINPKEWYDTHLQDQAQKDRVFLERLGPRIAQRFVDHLQLHAVTDTAEIKLPVDTTLLTGFRNDLPLYASVRMGGAALPAAVRKDIKQIQISGVSGNIPNLLLGTLLPADSRVIVESGTMHYRTRHYAGTLFRDARIRNDLTNSDDVRISARVTPQELRNPRKEDREHARLLLEHLNERMEDYHHRIWAGMGEHRRYMLLDGFIAPNAGGRSVASVVDNELIGIVGNCLVMPVSRGYHLDPTFKQDDKNPVDLIEHYQPETPVDPMRIAIPTKGVYAESVMGACNSCEIKEEERFWRWEEAPIPDQLPLIQPVSTDSRRSEPGDLQPKDFPSPIIAMQSAPAAPDPTGLAQIFGLLGRSDLFRDMAGLAGTQQNAAAALQGALQTAQFFGGKAADLAMQGRMARDIDKSMRAIQGARTSGLLDDKQASQLAQSAIRGMIGESRPAGAQALTTEPEVKDLLRSQAEATAGDVTLQRNGETVQVHRPAVDGAGPFGAGSRPTTLNPGSRPAEAQAAITAFAARTTPGKWKLSRAEVAQRLSELVTDPNEVDQDSLNLCGPAVFLRFWIARDPLAVVRFAAELYETGASRIGDYEVAPDDDSLLGQDYAALKTQAGSAFCPPADWMILGALRDAENAFFDFEGRPDESVAAATTPGEVADWLRATGLYRNVRDEGNFFMTKGLDHLLNLAPTANRDIALLINAHIIDQANVVNGPKKSSEFILSAFPNHFVALASRVQPAPGDMLEMSFWTWGEPVATLRFDRDLVDDNYYGAVIADR